MCVCVCSVAQYNGFIQLLLLISFWPSDMEIHVPIIVNSCFLCILLILYAGQFRFSECNLVSTSVIHKVGIIHFHLESYYSTE